MVINIEELFKELYDKFPDKIPDQVTEIRDLYLKVGNQQVIKYIEHIVELKEHSSKNKVKK